MAHWLFKSEPSSWSWEEQIACGRAGTAWTGVRNHLARKQLEAMVLGEQGFFYHSGDGKAVVGIVEVVRTYYPDPTDASGRFGAVDIRALAPLPEPVTLETIRSRPDLADMVLVKNSRLSVQPVTAVEWRTVQRLGGG